ncbi:MAG: polysulfide reductase NrfD [Chloroflexi bacterium]|nr:polysulfide reductase NrfD [Chloroflexota bacterium]
MIKNLRARLQPSPWLAWVAFLSIFLIAGVVGGVIVLWEGLSVTNLTDLIPWGLWITIDLSSIALAAGAFSLCAVVYLIGLKKYEPIARTATFVGLIGYSMAMLCLFMDIGRPFKFYQAFIYWNTHSLLWEVTMCVGLYFTVLLLESMPIIANWAWLRARFPKLAAKMSRVHHYAPYLAIAGLFLSSLHQSSLGAAYGVLKSRPFWYKPEMSVLFMLSAIVGGISMTLLASMLAARVTNKAKVKDELIEKLSQFVGWALVGYFYWRFWDTLSMTYTYEPGRTEGLHLLTKGPLAFNFWFGEILLGIIIPMILLLKTKTRANRFWRMSALLMVVGGVVAYRWNINLSGALVVLSYLPGQPTVSYASYTPSLIEWMVGLGVIAYGFLAFSLGVRYLHVVDHDFVEYEHVEVGRKIPEAASA